MWELMCEIGVDVAGEVPNVVAKEELAAGHELDGVSLYRLWPFEVPPEGSKVAVSISGIETGVTMGNTNAAWNEVSYGA